MAKSEKTTTSPAQPQAQQQINFVPLQIHGQYIKDLSFETPGPLYLPASENPSINLNIEVRGQHLNESNFEVELRITAEATQKEGRLFLLELCYAGAFGLPQMAEENIRPFLLIECPRLLFPYARAIVSETTRDGGFVPLNLSPVDFAEIYRKQGEPTNTKAQPRSTDTPPTETK